ncbi:DUF1634 domain-containing protein [Segatella paludivivens]|uniref:DUF1634 domain-containing protein n=1 Tax=Segatella paludivivens TaxID=185294 RepID=UPI0003796148|nr:DUF1634 domain-containing protein [Segatella paludivivens]
MELMNENKKMQQLIGSTLRIGVMTACCIAVLGGAYYLICHGSEPVPDYYKFHGEPSSLTSLSGIFGGLLHLKAANWIQLGVLVLMLTPITRILLSLFDFAHQRDWLYVTITMIVFLVILSNSLGGIL